MNTIENHILFVKKVLRNNLLFMKKIMTQNLQFINNFNHLSFFKNKTNLFFKPLTSFFNLFKNNDKQDNHQVVKLTTKQKYEYIIARERIIATQSIFPKFDSSDIFNSLDDRTSYLGIDLEKIQNVRIRVA